METIEELFNGAIENSFIDLQALIMFLVFEKKVLTMDDKVSELNLYYLDKHRERMNKLITDYKNKMNMEYALICYRIQGESGTYYIAAPSEAEAVYMAHQNYIDVKTITLFDENTKMLMDGVPVLLKSMMDESKILGGNQNE